MKNKHEFDRAYERIKNIFPFVDYIDMSTYFQMRHIVNKLRSICPAFEKLSLLDIGCGPLDKTAIFNSLGFKTYAVDDLDDPWHKQNDNIATIIKFAHDEGVNFYKQEKNDYSIPFPDNFFDVITSISVFEHLHSSPRLILNSIGKLLKPKGVLVIAMPNSVSLRKRLSVMLGKSNYNPVDELYYSLDEYRGHIREYTLDETEYICKLSGYKVVHSSHFEHLAYEKLSFPLKQLYLIITSALPSLRNGVLVIARKPDGWSPKSITRDDYFKSISDTAPILRHLSNIS